MPVIRIENLTHVFPGNITALAAVSMEVNKGEVVAVTGRNGAGKTTLVKHFNGLLKPTSGRVWINGKDTLNFKTSQLSAMVGFAFQNPDDQIFSRTVEKEISCGPRNLGFSRKQTDLMVAKSLEITGLEENRQTNPCDLSPAKRKIVSIASILAMDTQVVVMDEPTMSQDLKGKKIISNIIKHLKEDKKTVVSITHDMDFVSDNFSRMIVVSRGGIFLDGPTEEVFLNDNLIEQAGLILPQTGRLANEIGLGSFPLTGNDFLSLLKLKKMKGILP